MVHGNVRVSSIFVNPAGEWKLGSFDLLSSMQEESPIILVCRKGLMSKMPCCLTQAFVADVWRIGSRCATLRRTWSQKIRMDSYQRVCIYLAGKWIETFVLMFSLCCSLPTAATDSFHLGCLIYEAYNRRFDTIDQLSASKGDIPNNMVDVYRALIRPSPSNRADAGSFLDQGLRANGFFTADFVQVNLFLENISIKEQGQKEIFFK